jgi:hypothetical protein
MAENPWFKFWARDFLTDPDVDNTPDAAMLLSIKMWCVCCIEGSCPAAPEEISRKTRVPLHRVTNSLPYCQPFFELRGDRLFSKRMEKEKAKSDLARQNAEKRYRGRAPATGSANSSANGSASRSAARTRPVHPPDVCPECGAGAVSNPNCRTCRELDQWVKEKGLDREPQQVLPLGSDASDCSEETSARSPADRSANGSAVRTAQKARKPESQKPEGPVHVEDSVHISTVVSPVETVEIVESVPHETSSLESLKKKAESVFDQPTTSELERRRQEQKQKLREWQNRKGNTKTNINPKGEIA